MKQLKIATYLRPALLEDIFSNEGSGAVLSEKQIFYKTADNNFIGPSKLQEPIVYVEAGYLELITLIHQEKIFVVDPAPTLSSVKIYLKIKQVEEEDILENNKLITNLSYFLNLDNKVKGPFILKPTTTKADLYNYIYNKEMFVFSEKALIKPIEKLTLEPVLI